MIYTKEINGRQVFSNCQTLRMQDGRWVSNPTSEMIAQEGWVLYVPPVIDDTEISMRQPDMMDVMQAVKTMLKKDTDNLTDEEALGVAALFPTWESMIGKQVSVGDRYWHGGKLWKVTQQHVVQEDWVPDNSPSLFQEVSVEEWPQYETPDSSNPYMTGDRVVFGGKHYICKMDNCVWSPEEYPTAWEEA